MSNKHYTADYLEDTGIFLRNLKEATYKPFNKTDQGIIIDLGCGTGIDVMNMADILHEQVKIVGIDHDQAMLEKGRLANTSDRVDFIQSEAVNIPFPDNSVSGLRAERLVQHLISPEAVFSEVKRVLKDDHPFVIIETDWSGLIFYDDNIIAQKKVIDYLTEIKINNGFASRKLIGYLKNTGFNNIKIDVVPFILKSLKEANTYLWIEIILREAMEKAHLTKTEHDVFLKSLKLAEEEGYFSCSINIVVVTSYK